MNTPISLLLLLCSLTAAADQSWRNAPLRSGRLSPVSLDLIASGFHNNPQKLLSAIENCATTEQGYLLSKYLKDHGYVPSKDEIEETFRTLFLRKLESRGTERFLAQWGESFGFESIYEMIMTCIRFIEPVPQYLFNRLNAAKPTIEFSEKLVSLMEKARSLTGNTSPILYLSPFFDIAQDDTLCGGIYAERDSMMTQIKNVLESRKEALQNINLEAITDADIETYLGCVNSCLEDVLEAAVKGDNYHLFHSKQEVVPVNPQVEGAEAAEDVPLIRVDTANSVTVLLSKGADPFALDTVTGEPLSALPNLSPEIRKILLSAQAAAIFPKIKALMLHEVLVHDTIGEISQQLIQLEFAERKAKLLL